MGEGGYCNFTMCNRKLFFRKFYYFILLRISQFEFPGEAYEAGTLGWGGGGSNLFVIIDPYKAHEDLIAFDLILST